MKQAANANIHRAIKTNRFQKRNTLLWCVRTQKKTQLGQRGMVRFVQKRSSDQQKAMDSSVSRMQESVDICFIINT